MPGQDGGVEDTPPDVTTDPKMDDESTDWSGEGGALPQGPATDEDADEAGAAGAREASSGDDS